MGEYVHLAIDDVPDVPNPTTHKKQVDEAVGCGSFGFNVYTVEPGQRIPWGYHHHPGHDELFYVISGELTVETDDGEYVVGPREVFYVPRGSPQRARATGEEVAHVVAVGAPKDSDRAVISEECPACGAVTDRDYEVRDHGTEDVYVLLCADCGAETDEFHA